MDFSSDERVTQIREFISQFRAEIMLLAMSGAILIFSGSLFLIIPTQVKTRVQIDSKAQDIPKQVSNTYIYVDIAGAVMYPDVYKLPSNTRLKALIEKAGGYSPKANMRQIEKSMNMSRTLSDQEKVYVPTFDDESIEREDTVEDVDDRIHINSSPHEVINSLEGVGDVTTQKIVSGRPYRLVSDLVTRKIVGKALFEKIKDQITL